MSGQKKKKKNRKGQNVKIYARVRCLMPWEPRECSLIVKNKKVRNKTPKTTNEYSFQKVFDTDITNEEIFETIVTPMIDNVLQGFNAVLIAYGQTGSGKTFSMLGKPHLNVVGLLPYMLKTMVESDTVNKVMLTAVEAFGHHVARIELFDLFDPINQTPTWGDKKGNTGLEPTKARKVRINDMNDAYEKIKYAHAGSHFAPTGKNPESSRGHVTFIATIHQTDPDDPTAELTSHFIMVDCAGSEGESAFTPDFIAACDKTTLMARRLEAGCINTGLSQLQIIFNELKNRGQLSKMHGNGLRRVLHPYINTRTFLSVLFTFSPSANNAKATESTLKFAVTAGMVKVNPVKEEASVNVELLVNQLRKIVEENEKTMEQQADQITDLQLKLEQLKQEGISAGNLPTDLSFIESDDEEEAPDLPRIDSANRKRAARNARGKTESVLPKSILQQLHELDEMDEIEETDEPLDEMFMAKGEGKQVDAKQIEKEMEAAMQEMAKTNDGAKLVRNVIEVGDKKGNAATALAMRQLAETLGAAHYDPSLGDDFRSAYLHDSVVVDIDFSDKSKAELVEVCVESFEKIEENREEQHVLKKQQQHIVSHLVDTNEWLFNTLTEVMDNTSRT